MQQGNIISVAIPFYNEEKFLDDSIQSLINQSYKRINIILSDNCSTDGSYEIAKKYADKHDNIVLIKHVTNIGAVGNFEYTREIAKTKYFMWLGAHDIICENFVEEAINFLEANPSFVLYYPKARYFEKMGVLLDEANSNIESISDDKLERMMNLVTKLAMCTAIHGVFRTDIIQEIPFDERGADNLILFLIVAYGKISASSDTQYYRRVVRKENNEEFVKRMKQYGMGKADTMLQYRVEVYQVHFKYIFNNEILNFSEKMELFFRLRDLCLFRYPQDFTRMALLKYFLTKNVDLPVALMLPVAYIFELLQLLRRKLGK